MSTTPSHQRTTRSVSGASSGDCTVRPRRPSSTSASEDSVNGDETDEAVPTVSTTADEQSMADVTHPSEWTVNHEDDPDTDADADASATAADVLAAQHPPPLWRQMSDRPYNPLEDPEEGPSDYWRRPSPPLAPELPPPAPESPWLRTSPLDGTGAETPDGEGDHADAIEYSKRLEQVLSLTHDSPTPSPTKRRSRNGSLLSRRADDDDEGWSDHQPPNGGYEAAVRDVLQDGESVRSVDEKGEEEFGVLRVTSRAESELTPSTASASISGRERSHPVRASPSGPSRSYIHPSVSRLRSQPLRRMSSSSSHLSAPSVNATPQNRIASHFSRVSISRSNSFSTVSIAGPSRSSLAPPHEHGAAVVQNMGAQGPAFTFHPLRQLSAHLFNRTNDNGSASPAPTESLRPSHSRRSSLVRGLSIGSRDGAPLPPPEPIEGGFGRPTVMDINGMIAIGTESGYVVVYGFDQDVRYTLGTEVIVHTSGPVTAVTVCPDQTYIGVGHASGNIFLYDLSRPAKPARTQLALPLKQVLSGRKEGHLQGSRIVHIGFVGKRHTSIVTADEDGRAFWFSLGRVMGVDSNDAVRMLGSYPEREPAPPSDGSSSPRADGQVQGSRSHPSKRPTTLFASIPLPLGQTPHPTDEFHFSALLTPVKLVVVGMKPSAKTWFRKMRESSGGPYGGYVGCAAWLKSGEVMAATKEKPSSDPVLAYSWGTSLRFLRVRISTTPSPAGGKSASTKTPEFVEGRRWEAPHPIQSLHWYDPDHVLLITQHEVILLNVRAMTPVENTPLQTRLLTSQDFYAGLSVRKAAIEAVPNCISSSARTHRGKLFLLTRANVQVGTLQHWNDRVLANVHRGDFLAAINLALAYYEGRAAGNTINLPDDAEERREVVGARVRELMTASLDWAFSEDRMHDDTHYSADGRGVDLTSLFEGLAAACIDACIAMDDMGFLFDTTFEHFANAGISAIFLIRLEAYIFDGRIADIPPNVVQALIAMHDDRGEYALAEAVIWHMPPMSLDINQVVTLCEKRELWDALIHVYTRAMGDYIAPIVKLVRIVCDVQRNRYKRPSLVGDAEQGLDDEERLAPDAYKLYAYVAHVLTGLWYPSGETIREPDGTHARAAAYGLLFSDRNVEWPEHSGELILTEQDDGTGEPAYPYLRLLLRFDTEAFLHAMDIAFEDSYLNDPSSAINRQSIINLMLDVMDNDFHSSDVTLLHIFVARNLPKYPQFIFIPPSTSHHILVSLAADPDQSTREDRQLAAEYLLSAYTPHDGDEMLGRFEQAGFFRILRAAYRRDRKWGALVETLLKDPEADDGVFASLDEIIATSKPMSGIVPTEVSRAVADALPQLFDLSVRQTARFLDRSLPSLHDDAIAALESAEHKQAAYLRCLLDPGADEEEGVEAVDVDEPQVQPTHLHMSARHKYVALLARHDASAVVPFLDARGPDFFELPLLAEEFEAANNPEGQLWALDRAGRREEVFSTVDAVLASRGSDLASALHSESEGDAHLALGILSSVAHMAIRLCREHSDSGAASEDMWFGVLHSITELVHSISALQRDPITAETKPGTTTGLAGEALETLRGLVQDTLQALLSTSASGLSFARLFKRLVEAAPGGADAADAGKPAKGKRNKHKRRKSSAPESPTTSTRQPSASGTRAYSEFRAILTGMLDTFKADSTTLALNIRLIEGDMFDLLDERVALSQRGWRPGATTCAICHKPLWDGKDTGGAVDVHADGEAVHAACVARDDVEVEEVEEVD